MKVTRRSVLAGLSAFAATPGFAAPAWPTRPILLVHGFPPGGPVDVLARILSEPLAKELGQPVIIEPKPGATGMIAAGQVARATFDGYTLLAVPGTYTAAAAMFRTLPFHPADDFTFISTTAESPLVLVTHDESNFRSVDDVIKAARARTTPLHYGTAGVGSIQHLSMELLARKANIALQHVPYKGGMPAITDLIGRRIDLVLDPPTALLQFVKAGKLRALAVTSADRFPDLPDVPTVSESGFRDFVATSRHGIAAPSRLPDDIVRRLNAAIASVLADRSVGERLKAIGSVPTPSSPEGYKARVVSEIALWKGVVADARIEQL